MNETNLPEAESVRPDLSPAAASRRFRGNLLWWNLTIFATTALVVGIGFFAMYFFSNLPD